MSLNKIKLKKFLNKLISYPSDNKVDNQYKNKIQIQNLKMYLENMDLIKPNIVFIGEAPGYQGCAITGIPFTSEYIISSNRNSLALQNCVTNGLKKEPTATIMWSILGEKEKQGVLCKMPLMWNIFPFHPINNGIMTTNRKPNSNETLYGVNLLNDLLDLFPSIEKIYAVGMVATEKIKNHPKFAGTLRHPSNGGKQKFKDGIEKIYL